MRRGGQSELWVFGVGVFVCLPSLRNLQMVTDDSERDLVAE